MLRTHGGKEFNPNKLPSNKRAREAVLATVIETATVTPGQGRMFNMGERARLTERKK